MIPNAELKLSMGNQELLKIDSKSSKFHFYGGRLDSLKDLKRHGR